MDSPKDLKRVLAEEVRAAIAETAPSAASTAPRGDAASESARAALSRAEDVLTPAVPEDAPFSAVKRLAIRALRFLWRNQSSFNSLSLAAASGLADGLDRLRAESSREIDELARRAGIQESRLTLVESSGGVQAGPARGSAPTPPAVGLPAGVYALFEERFRGSPADVARGQRFYLDFLKDLPGPVLDVGCGRGEFLGLLKTAGIRGAGLESNPVTVEACRPGGARGRVGRRPRARSPAGPPGRSARSWPSRWSSTGRPRGSSGSSRRRGACSPPGAW